MEACEVSQKIAMLSEWAAGLDHMDEWTLPLLWSCGDFFLNPTNEALAEERVCCLSTRKKKQGRAEALPSWRGARRVP